MWAPVAPLVGDPVPVGFHQSYGIPAGGDRIAASSGASVAYWNASSGRPLLRVNVRNEIAAVSI